MYCGIINKNVMIIEYIPFHLQPNCSSQTCEVETYGNPKWTCVGILRGIQVQTSTLH
jgi:hypothetical protein